MSKNGRHNFFLHFAGAALLFFLSSRALAQGAGAPYIISSIPPESFVDAREDYEPATGESNCLTTEPVTITFSEPIFDTFTGATLSEINFYILLVQDGDWIGAAVPWVPDPAYPDAPVYTVNRVVGSGSQYEIHFNPGLPPRVWALIEVLDVMDANGNFLMASNGRATVTVGCLSMDVDSDSTVTPFDAVAWTLYKQGTRVPPAGLQKEDYVDTDRDGDADPWDTIRASQLLNGIPPPATRYLGKNIGSKPQLNCTGNRPPVPSFTIASNENHEVWFEMDGTTDPDPFPFGGWLQGLRWNFGDGTVLSAGLIPQSHLFLQAGTYQVALTAFDICGASATQTQSVTVGAIPGAPFAPPGETNGTVLDIEATASHVYVAGTFTKIRPYTGSGAVVDATTSLPLISNTAAQAIKGWVHTAVPDGNGGFYVGGQFSTVGAVVRHNLARIKSDGTLDTSFNVQVDGTVWVLALSESSLYLGGIFRNVNGLSRPALAEINLTTGQVTSFRIALDNGNVQSIGVSPTEVFVGGQFQEVGGTPRASLASFNRTTGAISNWNPGANSSVSTIYYDRATTTVYIGGFFTAIGGQARNYLAAISATTGTLLPWNPNANGYVRSISVSGSTLYLGGNFTQIGGQTRNYLAAVGKSDSNPTAWNPNANWTVDSVYATSTAIYVGGGFSTIGSLTRLRAAALSPTDGVPTNWNPEIGGGSVLAISAGIGKVYVGGSFNAMGWLSRPYVVQLDATTGVVTTWDPQVNDLVQAVTVLGNTVYLGGDFTSVRGQPRNFAGAVNAQTGAITGWNPALDGEVTRLRVADSVVYLTGYFVHIGGSLRRHIGRVDTAQGVADNWNPDVNSSVLDLLVDNNAVYLAGAFNVVAGEQRPYLAAVDKNLGDPLPWNPAPDQITWSIARQGSALFVSGGFGQIAGTNRARAAKFDLGSGQITPWAPALSSEANTIAFHDGNVILGGAFQTVNGETKNGLAEVDSAQGANVSWDAGMNGSVNDVVVVGDRIYVGGSFSRADFWWTRGLALFER